MRNVVPALVAVGCILLGAALHALLGSPVASTPVGDPTLDGRFDGLAARLERIEASVAALRETPVRFAAPTTAVPPGEMARDAELAGTGHAPAPQTHRSTAKPSDLPAYVRQSTEKLWLDALSHSTRGGDAAAAALRWQALLLREIDPEQKADAHRKLGLAWRRLGEHEKSLAAFRDHLEAVPKGGPEEAEALFFLGWTRYLNKDPRGALADAERVQRHPEVVPFVRANARWMQALALRDLGDTGESSRVLEAMVRDYAEDDKLRSFADRARAELEKTRAGLEKD